MILQFVFDPNKNFFVLITLVNFRDLNILSVLLPHNSDLEVTFYSKEVYIDIEKDSSVNSECLIIM